MSLSICSTMCPYLSVPPCVPVCLCACLAPHHPGHHPIFGVTWNAASGCWDPTTRIRSHLNNLSLHRSSKPPLPPRRDLEGSERVLGPDHPDTLVSLNNLAVLLQAQGKLEEAEPLYRWEGCGRFGVKCEFAGGPVNDLTGRLERGFMWTRCARVGEQPAALRQAQFTNPLVTPCFKRAVHVHTCSTLGAALHPPCCCAGARSKPRSAFWVHTTPAPSQVWHHWQGYCRRRGSCRKLSGCTGACHGNGPCDVCVMWRLCTTVASASCWQLEGSSCDAVLCSLCSTASHSLAT